MKSMLLLILPLLLWYTTGTNADKPCAAQARTNRSVVCVCNATYCDEVTRDVPQSGQFVYYVTSEGGQRLNKSCGKLVSSSAYSPELEGLGFWSILGGGAGAGFDISSVLILKPEEKYQTIVGFGGAVTDSAAITWKTLPEGAQQNYVNSYFSETGNEYNMIRTPIGGSDFSARAYAYNELPENDTALSNYTLAVEDTDYKLPLIKAAFKVATSDVNIITTVWSPPVWMKTSDQINGQGYLLQEFYDTYALYFKKFIDMYTAAGVPIWAVTTTNEPIDGTTNSTPLNDLGWKPEEFGQWIGNNLGPMMKEAYPDLLIYSVDDQRITIPIWYDAVTKYHPKAMQYIDGIAVHYYMDKITSPEILDKVHLESKLPILYTEAAPVPSAESPEYVDMGSWPRATDYIESLIQDLNHYATGWIEWNLSLNEKGGPNWKGNGCDASVIVLQDYFIKNPTFYVVGHFSKFMKRGSVRIGKDDESLPSFIQSVAVLTPDNTIVTVLYNSGPSTSVSVRVNDKQAVVVLETNSLTTIEMPYECSSQTQQDSSAPATTASEDSSPPATTASEDSSAPATTASEDSSPPATTASEDSSPPATIPSETTCSEPSPSPATTSQSEASSEASSSSGTTSSQSSSNSSSVTKTSA